MLIATRTVVLTSLLTMVAAALAWGSLLRHLASHGDDGTLFMALEGELKRIANKQ